MISFILFLALRVIILFYFFYEMHLYSLSKVYVKTAL